MPGFFWVSLGLLYQDIEKNFSTVFTLSPKIISFTFLHYHLYFYSSQYYGFKIYCVCFLPSITIVINSLMKFQKHIDCQASKIKKTAFVTFRGSLVCKGKK